MSDYVYDTEYDFVEFQRGYTDFGDFLNPQSDTTEYMEGWQAALDLWNEQNI